MRYRTTVDLVDTDLRISHVHAVMDILRELGSPELESRDGVPLTVTVEWEIGTGDDAAAPDLWDFREDLENVEAQLTSYLGMGFHFDKPVPVEGN